MARKADPQTPNIVRSGINNGYRYAYVSKVIPVGEEPDVRYVRRKIQLGRLLEGNVFEPNKTFRLMDIDTRRALIFPREWDIRQANLQDTERCKNQDPPLSKPNRTSGVVTDNTSDIVHSENEDELSEQKSVDSSSLNHVVVTAAQICSSIKIYGAAWLLEKIAEQKGVTNDLLEVFDGNIGTVNDVLTLACYLILSDRSFSRLERWLDTHKAATDHRFEADYIIRLLQSITEDHRMRFIDCRLKRETEGSIDASTRSENGKFLVDLKYGYNKDREDSPCILEVYVYSRTSHEPKYYKRMSGNTSDLETIRAIHADLNERNIKQDNLSFRTVRGYCSEENMGTLHKTGSPFLVRAKVNHSPVIECLQEIKYNKVGLPVNMEYDRESKLYCRQADAEDFTVTLDDGEVYSVRGVKVNLYMDPEVRLLDAAKVRSAIQKEKQSINDYIEGRTPMPTIEEMRSLLKYHYVKTDKENQRMEFELNQAAEKKAYAQCGFFASCMYRHSFNAIEALCEYRTRDEYGGNIFCFRQDEGVDMHDFASEECGEGRAFISFASLILLNTVTFTWKEKLRQMFRTSVEVLDAMSTIQYSKFIRGADHMTTFNAEQISICDAFGITPPKECVANTAKERWRGKSRSRQTKN